MKTFILFLLWILLLLAAPMLGLHDPVLTDPSRTLEAPSFEHPCGTDNAGRDVLSRTIKGGQYSVFTASLAAIIALIPALFLGMLAGMSPSVDKPLVILVNTILAFPALLLALVILTRLGRGLLPIAVATGISQMA